MEAVLERDFILSKEMDSQSEPGDLLPAVGEGGEEKEVVPQSIVELYNNTGVHLGHLSSWRLPFRRSGVGSWASFKNHSSPSLLWSSSQ